MQHLARPVPSSLPIVATFKTEKLPGEAKFDSISEKVGEIVKAIEESGAHLLALQELTSRNSARLLAWKLGENEWKGGRVTTNPGHNGLGFVWRAPFELDESIDLALPKHGDLARNFARLPDAALFSVDAPASNPLGQEQLCVMVVNVHCHPHFASAKHEWRAIPQAVKELRRQCGSRRVDGVIILGDFQHQYSFNHRILCADLRNVIGALGEDSAHFSYALEANVRTNRQSHRSKRLNHSQLDNIFTVSRALVLADGGTKCPEDLAVAFSNHKLVHAQLKWMEE